MHKTRKNILHGLRSAQHNDNLIIKYANFAQCTYFILGELGHIANIKIIFSIFSNSNKDIYSGDDSGHLLLFCLKNRQISSFRARWTSWIWYNWIRNVKWSSCPRARCRIGPIINSYGYFISSFKLAINPTLISIFVFILLLSLFIRNQRIYLEKFSNILFIYEILCIFHNTKWKFIP